MLSSLTRILLCLACLLVFTSVAFAAEVVPAPSLPGDNTGETEDNPPVKPAKPKRKLVRSFVKRPKPIRKVKRFEPWASPSPAKVKKIIELELKRWGGPSIMRRVGCESTYRWNATNGRYRGLLQFGPIWRAMWAGTPRGVKIVRKTKVKRAKFRIRIYSDGTRTRKRIGKVKVRKRVILKGKLPRNPSPYHAWAAIRVGQRAVSGHGMSTYWECGL